MPRRTWIFSPNATSIKVPEDVKRRVEGRIRRYADKHYAGKFRRLELRFRGQFCYIDAYTEPWIPTDWPSATVAENRQEYVDRLRATPLHLCRLRYFGDEEEWSFACFAYSSEKYEFSVFPDGGFFGTPEAAFAAAADIYLE